MIGAGRNSGQALVGGDMRMGPGSGLHVIDLASRAIPESFRTLVGALHRGGRGDHSRSVRVFVALWKGAAGARLPRFNSPDRYHWFSNLGEAHGGRESSGRLARSTARKDR